jgi:hypothetical protein
MPLSAALGANLWVVTVIAPLLLGGAKVTPALLCLALAAPIVLGWALARRAPEGLFVGFPCLSLAPLLFSHAASPPWTLADPPWLLAALSLTAYLVATARALQRHEAASAEAEAVALSDEPVPLRWRRRGRMYRTLSLAALGFPVTLVWALDLRRETVLDFDRAFGAHASALRALGTALIAVVSLFVFRYYLVAPLESHLDQDRETRARLEAAKAQARRRQPRARFYVSVALALAAMAAAAAWEKR